MPTSSGGEPEAPTPTPPPGDTNSCSEDFVCRCTNGITDFGNCPYGSYGDGYPLGDLTPGTLYTWGCGADCSAQYGGVCSDSHSFNVEQLRSTGSSSGSACNATGALGSSGTYE